MTAAGPRPYDSLLAVAVLGLAIYCWWSEAIEWPWLLFAVAAAARVLQPGPLADTDDGDDHAD